MFRILWITFLSNSQKVSHFSENSEGLILVKWSKKSMKTLLLSDVSGCLTAIGHKYWWQYLYSIVRHYSCFPCLQFPTHSYQAMSVKIHNDISLLFLSTLLIYASSLSLFQLCQHLSSLLFWDFSWEDTQEMFTGHLLALSLCVSTRILWLFLYCVWVLAWRYHNFILYLTEF